MERKNKGEHQLRQNLQDMNQLHMGDAYWFRQASNLTQQYEQAEDDVRILIQEVLVRSKFAREKEKTEHLLR
jgi:hypothetical protein